MYLYHIETQTKEIMTTIKSTSGKKAVNVRYNAAQEHFTAAHVQLDDEFINGDLIQMKTFSTEKRAITWANKVLA